MKVTESKQYVLDVSTVADHIVGVDRLAGKTILITGGTGLIGSAIVDLLSFLSTRYQIKIIVAGRNENKVLKRFDNVQFFNYHAEKHNNFEKLDIDFVICGAGNASPQLYTDYPVETMEITMHGVSELLKETNAKRVLFISSSEVYGKKEHSGSFNEDEFGYIDGMNIRSSYSVAKRAAETYGVSYANEYGKEFVIVRPGHIYGPTASRDDKRVSSDFAYKAAQGFNLGLKSTGVQRRSYCYCLDCASAILSVLTSGCNCQAYNISDNDSDISILEMAQIVAKAGSVKLQFESPNSCEKISFNPMDNSSLDSTKINQLGWKAVFPPEIGLTHTVEILRELTDAGATK